MKCFILGVLLLFVLPCSSQENYNVCKMSGHLRTLLIQEKSSKSRQSDSFQRLVCVLMKVYTQNDALCISADYGCQIIDSIGDIYIVNVPLCHLGQLSMDERIIRVEAHEMPRPSMNTIPHEVGADKVWEGVDLPYALKGENVVSGVVDFGFDFTHPMFYDEKGNIRIRQYFDMAKTDKYGVRCVAYGPDEIMELQHSFHADNQKHGTHVVSIMSGSEVRGEKGVYSGIAPESDIVLAEIGMEIVIDDDGNIIAGDLKNNSVGTSANCILAFKRIFDYADEQNKPCVINFSGGFHVPITDPCILENEAINRLLGPGHVLVAGAGNDGGFLSTINKKEGIYETSAMFLGTMSDSTSLMSKAKNIVCYLLTEDTQNVSFNFYGFRGRNIQKTITISSDSLETLNGDTCVLVDSVYRAMATVSAFKLLSTPSYVKRKLYQFEVDLNMKGYTGTFSNWLYTFGVGITLSSEHPCEFFTTPCYTPFVVDGSNLDKSNNCLNSEHSISWPAENENVIAVGATDNNKLAFFSSQGPSWSGFVKPEVVAPGVKVNAAYNHFCNTKDEDEKNIYDVILDRNGNFHNIITLSGTSMASPIVAGAIVLWLQAKPDLTPKKIKEILSQSCRHSDDIHDYPNNQYGYGCIDVYDGIPIVLGVNGQEMLKNQSSIVRFELNNRQLSVVESSTGLPFFDIVKLSLYTIEGRKMINTYSNRMDLSGLPCGVYLIHLESHQKEACGSKIIYLSPLYEY